MKTVKTWKETIKRSKVNAILIKFSPTIHSFDSELTCSYDVPPPQTFSWEEVGTMLLDIYRHASELSLPAQDKDSSDLSEAYTALHRQDPNCATVEYSSASQPPSCSPSPDDGGGMCVQASPPMYSEPPVQLVSLPPLKVCFETKNRKGRLQKDADAFSLSADEFIHVLNSQGRAFLHFCFCWATKRPLSLKKVPPRQNWSHSNFVALAEGLRGTKEEASVATEALFRSVSELCTFLEEGCHEDEEEPREVERALLCVVGSVHTKFRVRALKLLETLRNKHATFISAGVRPTVLCVGDRMDVLLDGVDERERSRLVECSLSLYVQVFFCGSVSWYKFWPYSSSATPGTHRKNGELKFTIAQSVEKSGFYDWRLVAYDPEKGAITESFREGRFIVFPTLKEHTETGNGCVFMNQKFKGDRRFFLVSSDGSREEKDGIRVMNFPLTVSPSTWHSRYKKYLSFHCESPKKSTLTPCYSVALSSETGLAYFNYRMPETVDLLLSELRVWLDGRGGSEGGRTAVVLQGDWPSLCAPSIDEMARLDEDGTFHHSDPVTSLESPFVDQGQVIPLEAEYDGANVVLAKIVQAVWNMDPEVLLCVETRTHTQHNQALRSGCVPVDTILESVIAQNPSRETYERMKQHIAEQQQQQQSYNKSSDFSSPAVVRIPPGHPTLSPFGYTLVQFGFVAVLGEALKPKSFLFEKDSELSAEKCTKTQMGVYNVEWCGSDGKPEQRIISLAAKQGDRIILVAFVPECMSSRNAITAAPVISSELYGLVPDIVQVSSLARRGALSLVPPQYMTRDEFCHEHHYTDFDPEKDDGIQVWVIAPSSCPSSVLYESSLCRLSGLVDGGIPLDGNMIYETLRDAGTSSRGKKEMAELLLEKLRMNLPHSSDKLFGSILSHLFFTTHSLPLCLLDLVRTSTSPSCSGILTGNELGTIVFVSAEMGRFSTVGGVGVLVDELTRSIAKRGYRVVVVTPYFNYNKYGHTDYLRPEDGFVYKGNISVDISCSERQDFGVHTGKEHEVDLVFLHNFTYFPTPYSGETADYKLRSVVALSKAALQACVFLDIKPSM